MISMKRFCSALIFILGFPFLLNAQLEITWGVPQKQERKTLLTGILGEDGSYVYALRNQYSFFGGNNPVLERYKLSDMSLDYSKSLSLKNPEGHEMEKQSIYFVKGNYIAFANYYDRDKNSNFLYATVLDNHATAIKSWTPVAEISADKRNNPGSFYTGVSADSSHILVVVNPPYDEYANEKFTLLLIDAQLNINQKREITPPYKDKYFSLGNFIASGTGNVFMLATISKDKTVMTRRERRNQPTYYHTVLMYDSKTDSLREFRIDLETKFISDAKMTIAANGDIVCSGFYSNKSSSTIIGTFYQRIDPVSGEIKSKGTMDFARDFLIQFMNEKKISKGKELADYDLKHLVMRDDGGAVLVAEEFYEVLIQSYDPQTRMYTYTYYYYYNNIIVISINPSGEIAWAQKIPKYQMSRNDGGYYSSFAFAVSGSNMYFMFNDHPRNLKIADSKNYRYMNNPKKSVAILVTLDSRGNQQRQAMFSNRDLKIVLRPKSFMQLNEKRMVLYGEKGHVFKLADVKIG